MTILNLAVIFYIPLDTQNNHRAIESSPYTESIQKLKNKTSLSSDEFQKLLELIEKNNQYFEDHVDKISMPENIISSAKRDWEEKSYTLMLITLLIWGIGFFWFLNHYQYKHFYLVLLFPALLTFFGPTLLPPLVFTTITVITVGIWYWKLRGKGFRLD